MYIAEEVMYPRGTLMSAPYCAVGADVSYTGVLARP
jgi:hypothetical protein